MASALSVDRRTAVNDVFTISLNDTILRLFTIPELSLCVQIAGLSFVTAAVPL